MSYQCTLGGRSYRIRDDMLKPLKLYIRRGIQPGGFLNSILINNFVEALGRADDDNIANIQAYASYLYSEAPSICWGSKELIDSWIKQGGLEGRKK